MSFVLFFMFNFLFIVLVYLTVDLDSVALVLVGSILGSLVGLNLALEKQEIEKK